MVSSNYVPVSKVEKHIEKIVVNIKIADQKMPKKRKTLYYVYIMWLHG
jgi:hypothetical protein